jgi:hypothetical protein
VARLLGLRGIAELGEQEAELFAVPMLSKRDGERVPVEIRSLEISAGGERQGDFRQLATVSIQSLQSRQTTDSVGEVSNVGVADIHALEVLQGTNIFRNAV